MSLEQITGAALILLFLTDVFMTVLYARAGTGLLAPYFSRAVWAALRAVAKLFGRRQGAVLSLAGPLIVISLVGLWALGLTIGAALIIQPELGVGILPSSGSTPTDFITAMFVAGSSLSIVGSGDYSPHTAGTRMLFLSNSLIGTSVLSLVLSYLVQVYSALRERNSLALTIHLMTGGTGDAAEMLARLLPSGDCSNADSQLSNLARSLAATKEAHHFYPLLFYFRFEEPFYAVSRFSFVLLDVVTLIDTALDEEIRSKLARSASATSLRLCTILLLQTLNRNFPATGTDEPTGTDERTAAYVVERYSYTAAIEILRQAGIAGQLDGLERYVAERQKWEVLIRRLAPTMGYDMSQIDTRRPRRLAVR